MTWSNVLAVAVSLLAFALLIRLVRKERLKERHAIWWFILAVVGLVVSLFPAILVVLSQVVGFQVASNFIFFASTAVLLITSVLHSVELTRVEAQIRTLAEHVAYLEEQSPQSLSTRKAATTERQSSLSTSARKPTRGRKS